MLIVPSPVEIKQGDECETNRCEFAQRTDSDAWCSLFGQRLHIKRHCFASIGLDFFAYTKCDACQKLVPNTPIIIKQRLCYDIEDAFPTTFKVTLEGDKNENCTTDDLVLV